MSDMYIDTDNFDFFNLSDITDDERAYIGTAPEAAAPKGAKASDVGANGGIVDDASDLSEYESYFEEEAEEAAEEAEQDPNRNLSDLADPNAANEALDVFSDLADDVPLMINGKTLTKAQIAEIADKAERVTQESELLSESAQRVDDINRFIMQNYTRNKTAIDLNIDVLQRKLSAANSDVEYGNLSRNLQSALEARQQLDNDVNEQMRLHDVQRADLANFRANQELQINSQKIPGYNEQRRATVVKHFADKGLDFNSLQHVWTPELAQVLHDAFVYSKGREKAQASAMERAKAKAPRSTASTANAQRTQAQTQEAAKRAALVNKAKREGLSEQENADLFNYLVD